MAELTRSGAEQLLRRSRVPLGFAFAAAFLVFARPSVASLLLSLLLVLPGLALRGYAAGYVKKNAELTQAGPYAWTRNPLYLGSFMAALGFVAAGRNLPLLAAFLLLFCVVYLPVIRAEERYLRSVFPGFADYCRRVPRLFPNPFRRVPRQAPEGGFSAARYRRHREYHAAMGSAAIYAALALLLLEHQRGFLPWR